MIKQIGKENEIVQCPETYEINNGKTFEIINGK